MNNDDKRETFCEAEVAAKEKSIQQYSPGKSLLFTSLILALVFGGLELILALVGIQPILLTEDPLVGFSGNVPLFIEERQSDGSVMLRTADNKHKYFNPQIFPKEKDNKSYRIFCLGGSTTYGRPYFDEVSFCGWLRAYLNAADSSRNWEVINAGGVSYASYRVARLMNELKQYQPDMFVIYSGQNEFLEHRSYGSLQDLSSWVLDLDSMLSTTRAYAALKKGIDALRSDGLEKGEERYQLTGEVNEILTHTAGPTSYHRDEKLQQQIITHYRLNLERMVDIAHDADAEIVLIKPASNLKDMSPFKSEHKEGLDKEALDNWQTLYNRGLALHEAGNHKEALAIYRQALLIDNRHADLHYRIGQMLYELGGFDQAEKAFWRATDEDIAPLRILSTMQPILEGVASRKDVPLVDFPGIIQKAYMQDYDHAIFGREYFVDHVHATIEGYRLLGLGLLDKLHQLGIVTPTDSWDEEHIEMVRQKVMATQDRKAQGLALRNLGRVLDWAGKFEEANNILLQALEVLGPDAVVYTRLGTSSHARGKLSEAMDYYRKAIALDPNVVWINYKLGSLLENQGYLSEAMDYYRKVLALEPEMLGVNYKLGNLLEQQGNISEAMNYYRKAVVQNPKELWVNFKIANLLEQQGKIDEALKHYQEELKLNKDSYYVHHKLGLLYLNIEKREAALNHFDTALQIKPDFEDAHLAASFLMLKEHRFDEAAAHVSEILRNSPRDYQAHNNLGIIRIRQGKIDEAISHFSKALRLKPDYSLAKENLQRALAEQKQAGASVNAKKQAP